MAWSETVGQPFAVRVIRAHLSSGRIPPAYLFVGPEGVGKRLVALELAKAFNCEHADHDVCDQCGSCRRIAGGVHPDVRVLQPHGASATIRIDEVRAVIAQAALRPFMARCGVVILDGAERLTEEAANSLLKVIEEPSTRIRFCVISAQPSACLPTIVSRCQVLRFGRLPQEFLEQRLRAMGSGDPALVREAARLAGGSLSQATVLLDQWDRYRAMTEQFAGDQPSRWVTWDIPQDRQELSEWVRRSILWLRDVAVASVADEALIAHQQGLAAIQRQAQRWNQDRCLETAFKLVELFDSMEQWLSPRLVGTLLREEWLELIGQGAGDKGQGNPSHSRPSPLAPRPQP